MKALGIIPARGGSKGIKNKNIRVIDGEPLIAYAIKAAQESKLLKDFVVTSDDEKILKTAESYHCKCHKRNVNNAQDNSPVELVVQEVLDYFDNQNFDLIILLQPTAPIRSGEDIDNVIKLFQEDQDIQNAVSVVKLDDIHPARMYEIDNNSNLLTLNSESEKNHRQELSSVYLRNGCIYAITTKAFLEQKTLILKEKKAYVMPYERWANIDSERDLILAETLVKLWKAKKI